MSAVVPVQVVGGIVKAADYNWLVGGSTNQRPTFFAVQNAAQSIANNTGSIHLKCQSVIRDTDVAYSTSTGIYTVATAGMWSFTATLQWAGGAGTRVLTLGVGSSYQSVDATADLRHGTALIAYANVGDTFVADVFQSTGGAVNTSGNGLCSMSAVWIGS